MNEKKKYVKPTADVAEFDKDDVIVTSLREGTDLGWDDPNADSY